MAIYLNSHEFQRKCEKSLNSLCEERWESVREFIAAVLIVRKKIDRMFLVKHSGDVIPRRANAVELSWCASFHANEAFYSELLTSGDVVAPTHPVIRLTARFRFYIHSSTFFFSVLLAVNSIAKSHLLKMKLFDWNNSTRNVLDYLWTIYHFVQKFNYSFSIGHFNHDQNVVQRGRLERRLRKRSDKVRPAFVKTSPAITPVCVAGLIRRATRPRCFILMRTTVASDTRLLGIGG